MGQFKLYLDVFFISGFWMHFLVLTIVRLFSCQNGKRKQIHILTASVLCTLFDVAGMFFLRGSDTMARFFLAGGEMVFATALSFGMQGFWLNLAGVFLMTVLLGGFFSLFVKRNAGLFCFCGALLLPAMKRLARSLKQRRMKQGYTYDVCLQFMNERKNYTAFLDTGNRLRLFGSSLPVLVARRGCMEKWIETARKACPQNFLCLPFSDVSGNGLLYGVKVDCRVKNEAGKLVFAGKAAAVGTEVRQFLGKEYDLLLQPEFILR